MVHADGSTAGHQEAHETKPKQEGLDGGFTKEALKRPEVQHKLTLALIKGGRFLRERASTEGTRQATLTKLLDAMTPEAQREFVENIQKWTHQTWEAFLNNMTGGLRTVWKVAAPTILPEEWQSLSTFNEEEIKGMIALGATNVDESTAQLIDGELKDKAKFLKVVSWLVLFLPEVGDELHELIGGIAHLAEAPAEFLEKVLPQVRAEVKSANAVSDTQHEKHMEIGASLGESVVLDQNPAKNPDWDQVPDDDELAA